MLAPLRNNRQRVATSTVRSVPAPVGGWDAKHSLADMPEDRAIILDNVFPNLSDVELRNGFEEYATGIGSGDVETLMEWSGPASSEFFAAGNNAVYDVSSSGAVGAAEFSSLTSTRFQHTMFSTSGGNFLWICNGADTPRYYNGSTWTTTTLTGSGFTEDDTVNVMAHQRRLYLAFLNSLEFGYLATVSVDGAVSTFNLAPIFSKGGYLMAMGSWTRDGGAGVDDIACFITSEGQVALYTGSDPGTADDWSLVGVFNIGKPIGRRCVFKVGADLVVITEDGYVPLSAILPIERVNVQGAALSDNIRNAATEAARLYGTLFGWQCVFYPKGSYALFNVPINATTSYQHVVNTQTGAWCRFTGQNALCWRIYGGNLYFGTTDGKVMKADTGADDNSSDIAGHIKPAFNYLGSRGSLKRFKEMRPLIESNGSIPVQIDWNVDYGNLAPTSVPTAPAITGAVWDTSLWDTGTWAASDTLAAPWLGIDGIGRCGTPNIRVSTSTLSFKLIAYDVLFERAAGGAL